MCAQPLRREDSGDQRRFHVGGLALLEWNGLGSGIESKNRAGKNNLSLFLVREDPSLYTPVSLHRVNYFIFEERIAASSRIIFVYTNFNIMHAGLRANW